MIGFLIVVFSLPHLLGALRFPSDFTAISEFNDTTKIKIFLNNASPDFLNRGLVVYYKEGNLSMPYSSEQIEVGDNSSKFIVKSEIPNLSPCMSYQNPKLKFKNCTIQLLMNVTVFFEFNFIVVSYVNIPNLVYSYVENYKFSLQSSISSFQPKPLSMYPAYFEDGSLMSYYDCETVVCEIPNLDVLNKPNQYAFNFQSPSVFGKTTEINLYDVFLIVRDSESPNEISFFQDVAHLVNEVEPYPNTYQLNLYATPPSFDLVIILDLKPKYEQYLYNKVQGTDTSLYLIESADKVVIIRRNIKVQTYYGLRNNPNTPMLYITLIVVFSIIFITTVILVVRCCLDAQKERSAPVMEEKKQSL